MIIPPSAKTRHGRVDPVLARIIIFIAADWQ
jgi:hypothetical protein